MSGILDPQAWAKVWQFRGTFLNGLYNTVLSAAVGLLLAFTIGVVLGLIGTGSNKLLCAVNRVYVEFFQNTPLLLQVCFLYYLCAFSKIPISILATGMIGLGIYHGAYMAEAIRAGILSIPRGQFEAAYSQGFGYIGAMFYIILPQTVKIILPPMVNQVVNLIKNTSCLYIIGGADLISTTYSFVAGEATGGAYGPAYLISGLLFFVVCCPLSVLASSWEARLKKREEAQVQAAHKNTEVVEITDAEIDASLGDTAQSGKGE